MALNFSQFMQNAQAQAAQFQNKSWWPDYARAYSQGKDALLNWAQTAGQNYPDFDGNVDGNFVGSQVAGLQSINSGSSWDRVGDVAGTLGKIGLAASLGYAGGVGLGALGEGAAVGAEGAAAGGAAGDAAVAGGAGADSLAGGAELGSGISSGSSASGIGGGATGTGITAGSTASGIGEGAVGTGVSGSAATGALAPGYFSAETAYPVIGGATAAAAGGATGGAIGGAAAGGLGGLTAADLLRGVPGVLGALAAKNQSDNLTGLAHEYMNLGAPSRARYESSFAPGFTMNNDPGYTDALNQSAKATLHGLSVGGNPADSPNAWAKSLQDLYEKSAYPALQNYRTVNAGAGGLAALTGASPAAATAGINANANVANGLGAAAADIFTPRKSLADILKEARY